MSPALRASGVALSQEGGPAGGTWVPSAFLSELFDHVGLTVGSRPGRAHVAVRAEDVGSVLGAVHEHRVGGRVGARKAGCRPGRGGASPAYRSAAGGRTGL